MTHVDGQYDIHTNSRRRIQLLTDETERALQLRQEKEKQQALKVRRLARISEYAQSLSFQEMNKRQREIEKSSSEALHRERTAVLKVLQELGYGEKAKSLTNAILMKFGERNVAKLFPNSHTVRHKSADDIYSALKGLYSHNTVVTWNMATSKPNKMPFTKSVASYTRYMTTVDEADAETNDNAIETPQNERAPMMQWGRFLISAPPEEDEEDATEDDEQ